MGCGPAHALGAPLGRHAVIASYGGDNEAKYHWLAQAHEHIFETQGLVSGAPVFVGIQSETQIRNHESTGEANQVGDDAEKKQHDGVTRRHAETRNSQREEGEIPEKILTIK